jgi:hypothetical protein
MAALVLYDSQMPRAFHLVLLTLVACGSNADNLGVGAQCTKTSECNTKLNEVCLTQFKGGYCGLEGCTRDIDCPTDSACVMHTDGNNYCFRICSTKDDCNANRDPANEANCSSSVTFVDPQNNRKACVPPS